jgi:hypothetical protein
LLASATGARATSDVAKQCGFVRDGHCTEKKERERERERRGERESEYEERGFFVSFVSIEREREREGERLCVCVE